MEWDGKDMKKIRISPRQRATLILVLFAINMSSSQINKPNKDQIFKFRDSLIVNVLSELNDKAASRQDSIFVDTALIPRLATSLINCREVPLAKQLVEAAYFSKIYLTPFGIDQRIKIPKSLDNVYYFNKNDRFNYCEGDTFRYLFFSPVIQERKGKKYVLRYTSLWTCKSKEVNVYHRYIVTKQIRFKRKGKRYIVVDESYDSMCPRVETIVPPFVRGSRPFFDENSGTYKYFRSNDLENKK
jgi:hypothetical protein